MRNRLQGAECGWDRVQSRKGRLPFPLPWHRPRLKPVSVMGRRLLSPSCLLSEPGSSADLPRSKQIHLVTLSHDGQTSPGARVQRRGPQRPHWGSSQSRSGQH